MWLFRLWMLAALLGAGALLGGALTASAEVDLAAAWSGALQFAPETLIALGAAVALWAIGLALELVTRGSAVRNAAQQLALGDAGRAPGWLSPVVEAARDTHAEARRAAPSAEVPAEVSAEVSAEESAEVSAEESAEESAERSAEESAEGSMSSAPPPVVPAEASASISADDEPPEPSGPRTVVRSGPPPSRRPQSIKPEPAPVLLGDEHAETRERRRPGDEDDSHGSLFEMPALRGVEALPEDEEDEPESDDVLSDADIRLPGAAPARPKGSLLAQLQRNAALEPEKRSAAPRPAPPVAAGERTQITPMPAELLAANLAEAEAEADAEASADAAQEAYFREVFDAFVGLKAECGERTDTLEFTRFRAKLLRTRAALIDRFDCHDVRFRVYEKAGRAALRAAPVLESTG